MKILNIKLAIAILCSIALVFTACSKEEAEVTNPVLTNDIAKKQVQTGENGRPLLLTDCRIRICVTLGANSTYTVGGAPQTYTYHGPYSGCVTVPFNNGETRNVSYSGTGGVEVYQTFKRFQPICPLWTIEAGPFEHTTTTLRPHCTLCP